jgi:hypothetical protein
MIYEKNEREKNEREKNEREKNEREKLRFSGNSAARDECSARDEHIAM